MATDVSKKIETDGGEAQVKA